LCRLGTNAGGVGVELIKRDESIVGVVYPGGVRLVGRVFMVADRSRPVARKRIERGERLCLGEPAADLRTEAERPDLDVVLPGRRAA
jgi:hypothetical protein